MSASANVNFSEVALCSILRKKDILFIGNAWLKLWEMAMTSHHLIQQNHIINFSNMNESEFNKVKILYDAECNPFSESLKTWLFVIIFREYSILTIIPKADNNNTKHSAGSSFGL